MKERKLLAQSCPTAIPQTVAHWLLCPWNYSGKSTGVGCHFLLQEDTDNTFKKRNYQKDAY